MGIAQPPWLGRGRIVAAISGLPDSTEVQFADEPAVEEAVFVWKDCALEFADSLFGDRNRRLGCRATASCDAKAAKLPGFISA